MKVKFIECCDKQVDYGGYDDPRPVLEIGQEYEVEAVHEEAWKTRIKLKGIQGHFNSVCFDEVE